MVSDSGVLSLMYHPTLSSTARAFLRDRCDQSAARTYHCDVGKNAPRQRRIGPICIPENADVLFRKRLSYKYIAGCDRQCPFNTDDDVNDGDGECEFGHGIPGTMSLASPPLAGEAEAARCSWLEGVCMIEIRRQGLWETSLG